MTTKQLQELQDREVTVAKMLQVSEDLLLAQNQVNHLKQLHTELEYHISMHVYTDHDDAECAIYDKLEAEAEQDCEGSYNKGNGTYKLDYKLSGSDTIYTGKISVEYNRHDKQYYFINIVEYSYSEKETK